MLQDNNKISTTIFLLLLIVFAVHLGLHVNDFYVPESDFFDFRDKAVTLRNLEWPDNFKRPPLYSTSIALVSLAIPGHQRELYAAEFIGVLAALAGLFFMFKISKRFFGAAAIFITWLWAFHPSTIRMAIKPKSEMLVTMLILWTFYLFLKNKKMAYLVGFLASLVRYEGAIIIAAIGIADFFMRGEKIKTIALSIASGISIVLWTFLQSSGGDGESYFSYFNEYKPNIAFLKTFWHGLVGFMPYQFAKVWILLAAGFFILGIVYGWKKYRRETLALLVFLFGFLTMHIVWPMPNFDYQILIVWNALVFLGLGAAAVVTFLARRIKPDIVRHPIVVGLCALFFVLMILFLLGRSVPFPQYKVQWSMLLVFFVPVLAGLIFIYSPIKKHLPFMVLAATFFVTLLYFMASDTNALLYSIRYSKAEFRAVGEWFAEHGNASDKMAVEQPIIVGYYAEKESGAFVRLTELERATPDQLHERLQEHDITYIAWMSANKIFATDNAWYEWKMENRGWKNIEFLAEGKSVHGFTLMKEIKMGPRWAYIYKI